MREPANLSTFPTAQCGTCGKTVLTYLSLTDEGESRRACVHCDAPVASELQWVTADELAADGYDIGMSAAKRRGSCVSGCACSVRGH